MTLLGEIPILNSILASYVMLKVTHRYHFNQVVTQPVYWDSKFIYLDQRLITLKDDIVRAAGYAKIACVKFDGEETIKKLFPNATKPEIPADLKKWNEACELSSELMKKKD
jgi:hypothetical protein